MSRTTRVRGQGGAGFQGQVVVNHGAGFLNGRGTEGLHAGLPVVAGHAVMDGVEHLFLFDDADEGDGQAEDLSGNRASPADTTRDGRPVYTGPLGGRYYLAPDRRKIYLRHR